MAPDTRVRYVTELMRFTPRATMASLLTASLLITRDAQAWGPDGHMAVGRIAAHFLTPATQAALQPLLRGERLGDLRVACWPDFIRGNDRMERIYPENHRWHYIDIPLDQSADTFAPSADGLNIVSQLEAWTRVLADPAQPDAKRRDAVRFLVHFAGDVHQPLHCAYRDDDRGGNLVPVHAFRGAQVTHTDETAKDERPNLHRVWDDYLVAEALAGSSVSNFADALSARITPEQVAAWSAGSPRDWAWETHMLAVDRAYRFTDGTPLPSVGPDVKLDLTEANYIAAATPVAVEQLQRAGVRLAHLLNTALGAQPPPDADGAGSRDHARAFD